MARRPRPRSSPPSCIKRGSIRQPSSAARCRRSARTRGSFMKLTPTVAVVTNIDPEHLDHYGTLDKLKRTFVDFINKVPFYGLAVLCVDHEHVQSILPLVEKRHVTYGFTPLANFRATDV